MAGPWEKYAAQQPVQISPADPKIPGAMDATAASTARTRQQMASDSELLPLRKKLLEAKAREAELKAARAGGTAPTAAAIAGARDKLRAAQKLKAQLSDLQGLWKKTQGGGRSLGEYLPTPENKRFDAAAAGLLPLAKQLYRVPGEGTFTDYDVKILEKLIPDRWSFDESNVQRFKQLQNMADIEERGARSTLGVKPGQPARRVKPKTQSKVIDFNDLPE